MESTLALVKSIDITSHVQTKLWIIEIVYSLSERIPLKDLYLENSKLKYDFQELVKQIFDDLTPVITKSRNFTHRQEIRAGIFNMFSKEER